MQVFVIIISYLIGSTPFGVILMLLSGNGNIKKIGSGNTGATNVLRTGKPFLALATLLLDAFKGFIVIYALKNLAYSQNYVYLSALALVIGHTFPIYLLFKGGKGIATFLGILIALNHFASIAFVLTWIVIFLIFKYSSLSSLLALTVSVAILCYSEPNMFIYHIIILLLVTFRHSSNIKRLLKNTEYKFKLFK